MSRPLTEFHSEEYNVDSCCYSDQTLLSSRLLSKNSKIYKTIILPVVLYGCEVRSLTLREESKLTVFENRILSRIFGPKMVEGGEWRRLGQDGGEWGVEKTRPREHKGVIQVHGPANKQHNNNNIH